MLTPPCYDYVTKTDCPNRDARCHGTCEKWKEYEESRNAEYKKRKFESLVRQGISEQRTENYFRTMKKRHLYKSHRD